MYVAFASHEFGKTWNLKINIIYVLLFVYTICNIVELAKTYSLFTIKIKANMRFRQWFVNDLLPIKTLKNIIDIFPVLLLYLEKKIRLLFQRVSCKVKYRSGNSKQIANIWYNLEQKLRYTSLDNCIKRNIP